MDELYEKIKQANETIRTTNIKGKEYAEVNQRIKAFRMVYPDGFIQTETIEASDDVCIMRASVGRYDEHGDAYILGTGTAYEVQGSSLVNETSYIENAETSAVGRALGMAGFGIDTSVASAEEVGGAIRQQTERKATEKQIKAIKKIYGDKYTDEQLKSLSIEKASMLIRGDRRETEEDMIKEWHWDSVVPNQ